MPVTIDRATALVVIDLQKGVVGMPTVHPATTVVANSLTLVRAFRAADRPRFLVRVGWSSDFGDALRTRVASPPPSGARPADFLEPINELADDGAGDIVIRKRQWGAFFGTDLDLQLRRRGITGIVLCGIATSIGVESTARDAYERGYNLAFASDAMTDLVAAAHDRAIDVIFPRIGEIGTTEEVISALKRGV